MYRRTEIGVGYLMKAFGVSVRGQLKMKRMIVFVS